MGKRKGKDGVNPADAERKKDAERRKKANAEARRKQREDALKKASVSDLKEEMEKITRAEKSGMADSHALDRRKRLEKELEEARIREKAAKERKAEPVTIVNIKGLSKIFKTGTKEDDDDDKKEGGSDDEEDDDESSEDEGANSTDPYQDRLKKREAESGAYTYSDAYRSNLPLALLAGAGSKDKLKKIARGEALDPVLEAERLKEEAKGGGKVLQQTKKKEEELPAPEFPPGLDKPTEGYEIPEYSFGRGLEEKPKPAAPAAAAAPTSIPGLDDVATPAAVSHAVDAAQKAPAASSAPLLPTPNTSMPPQRPPAMMPYPAQGYYAPPPPMHGYGPPPPPQAFGMPGYAPYGGHHHPPPPPPRNIPAAHAFPPSDPYDPRAYAGAGPPAGPGTGTRGRSASACPRT